ncbi:MAG: ribose-5-phosphate isomerase A [Candidatus Diapherotrites archaeon]|nr:ribose-5-phosphate isomerase A [Candidatus Diapherotrites archaeon]
MSISEEIAEVLIQKYVKNHSVVSLGTSEHALKFLKKLAFKIEEENLDIELVPTSAKMAVIASSFGLPLVSVNEKEIDFALEFASLADYNFDFVKHETHSLIRDKMIAQSAEKLFVVCEKKHFVKQVYGKVPFEISTFGWKRTLVQLDAFGKASLRKKNGQAEKTESGNFLIDVNLDFSHSLHEIDVVSKNIPGVIETGIFPGYADYLVLTHGSKITMKSRVQK